MILQCHSFGTKQTNSTRYRKLTPRKNDNTHHPVALLVVLLQPRRPSLCRFSSPPVSPSFLVVVLVTVRTMANLARGWGGVRVLLGIGDTMVVSQ